MTSSIAGATMTAWRRQSSKLVAPLPGRLVPVVPKSVNVQSQNTELDTLAVLVAVIAATPEWRPRLDDAERMRRLAHDFTHGMRTSVVTPTGMGWDSLDTFRAMRVCGYVHPFGRPLDDRPQPPVEQIVADVIRRMEANPYRSERTNDPRKIERLVRRHYLRIEPWPFAALVAD